jgi:CheY-like chemotaxis protein
VLAPIGRDSRPACALLEQADLSCWRPALARRSLPRKPFSEPNYQVLEADNDRDALDMLLDKDTVDLALIDLVMPGMNGRRLATRIRASDPQ